MPRRRRQQRVARRAPPLNFRRRRSEVNRSSIHREVIGYVFAQLGDDAYSPSGRLDSILNDAQAMYCPSVDTRTLRRWYNHFLWFGEVPAETKKWKSRLSRTFRREGRKSEWTNNLTAKLKDIVDENPHMFLDEIIDRLALLTGRKWSVHSGSKRC